MRKSGVIARRYAKALSELIKKAEDYEVIKKELELFLSSIERNEILAKVLNQQWVKKDYRKQLISSLNEKLNLSTIFVDFINLLIEKERLFLLPEILNEYTSLIDDIFSRARVKLSTPVQLSESERSNLKRKLSSVLNKREILIEEIVDEGVIGGFTAQIGGLIIDTSVRKKLELLREKIIKG